jgi:hypothetical protein
MGTNWKHLFAAGGLALLFVAGCGSSFDERGVAGSVAPRGSQVIPASVELQFAVLEGELSDAESSRVHTLRLHPARFTLPSGQALLKLTVEHEGDKSVQLGAKPGFVSVGNGLLGPLQPGSSQGFEVSGRGAYRVLVSLAGDMDGDGDVESSDLDLLKADPITTDRIDMAVADLNGDDELDSEDADIAAQNLGASTRVRPLEISFALDPAHEPYASLAETLNPAVQLRGRVSSGATVTIGSPTTVLAQAAPISVDENGEFTFQAPVAEGSNAFTAVATDEFGQRGEAAALVERLDQPSEQPAAISADKQNRIWLLDVHKNNYLFRGPLPLTSLEDDGQVDFPTLIRVMNQRLESQGAPINTLPSEFKFTEIALITNMQTASKSHGDEGFALHQIYDTILGGEQSLPPEDPQNPTSLFTKPLDNEAVEGPVFSQTVDGATYTIHPSVSWQPTAANSTGEDPTTLEGGQSGYKTVIASTFPIVSIAPDPAAPQFHLSNDLSNVSVAARYVQQLMQVDHSQDIPHIYYVHCINGHDRTGMVATAYVLGAYGRSFDFELETAYKYGQTGAYLPDQLPPGVEPDRNFWDKLEADEKNTGRLKKKYMQAVQALAYLYRPDGGKVQSAPSLTTRIPAVPLWQAGFAFANANDTPIHQTPPDYLHVRSIP